MRAILLLSSALATFYVLLITVYPALAQTITAQKSDIIINATLKKGDYVESNLYFQNATVSFGAGNKICPKNDCIMQFEDTTFNEFGQDRILSGTLKVEDKANSTSEFKSFSYYKLSGSFHLNRSMENAKTGEKILFYSGKLGIDTDEAIFNPEFDFDSKVKLTEGNFELNGNQI
jgi:hypothetical protein